MKKIFYFGLAGLAIFEILKVYFIMPMPGSQTMNSLDLAYFIYSYRWIFRIIFILMILAGSMLVVRAGRKWIPVVSVLLAGVVIYYFNFKLSADVMFKEPEKVIFEPAGKNALNDSSIVVGIEYNGQAKAYPIRFLVYHHQVQDTVGGKPFIVTYCSVCRTGRVFEPLVKGKRETFRLVGMDHFNAMFEDATTKSWWRQVNGEAVAGPLKGESLPEVASMQMTIGKWFALYPDGLVMQVDKASKNSVDTLGRYERGKSRGGLTRMDSLPWKNKSWVVGIQVGKESKAYDWISFKKQRVVNDQVGDQAIVLVMASDEQSFAAFARPTQLQDFTFRNDTIFAGAKAYDFSGRDLSSKSERLVRIKAYQEFWHSWKTFHPNTTQYQ